MLCMLSAGQISPFHFRFIFENERQSKVFKIIHLDASSSDVLQIALRVHDAQNYFILKDFDQLKSLQAGKC